jgi:hypothetical protein
VDFVLIGFEIAHATFVALVYYHFYVALLMILPISLRNEVLAAKLTSVFLLTSVNLNVLAETALVFELLLAFLEWTPVC